MLAKVIPQRKRFTTARAGVEYVAELDAEKAAEIAAKFRSASELLDYAARDGVSEGGVSAALARRGIVSPLDPLDRESIIRLIDETVERVRAKGVKADHPLYHVVLAWQPGERPSSGQAEAAVESVLRALGMREAAATWVLHRDKEHHHVHLLALRYDIDTLKSLGPPKRDYLILDRTMREIELAQGWQHSPGPHVVQNGMIRLEQRDVIRKDPEAGVEKAHGLPGIKAYCEHHGLIDKLIAAESWTDLHHIAAAAGLHLREAGKGLIIEARGVHGMQAVKASAVARALGRGQMEKRLGPYIPPPGPLPLAPHKFQAWQKAVARGEIEAFESPGRTGKRDPEKRARARAERAKARVALWEAFEADRGALPARRKQALADLKAKQAAEVRQLLQNLTPEQRRDASLLAALREKHAAERRALKQQMPTTWRAWLEMRARLYNDPAAIAALRGILYREKRKRATREPGIEGEDLRPFAVGGIEGEMPQFDWSRSQIEVSRDGTAVIIKDEAGKERIRDEGQRIELADDNDRAAMIAALEIAAKRYGGEVYITGDDDFRRRAAAECRKRGIRIANLELRGAVVEVDKQREL